MRGRQLCAILMLLCLLLSGCGGEDQTPTTEAPATDPVQTTQPSEPAVQEGLDIQSLRAQLAASGKSFGAAYLGYYPYEAENIQDFFETQDYPLLEQMPFLRRIEEANVVYTDTMGEVYCIIPADEDATVQVYGWQTEDGENGEYDRLLYETHGAEAILVVCNASFYPDAMVQISDSVAGTYCWYPALDEYLFVRQAYIAGDEEGMLDLSPYRQMLLSNYNAMLQEDSTWRMPDAQSLVNKTWYWEEYDVNGEYHLYQVEFLADTLNAYWNPGAEEELCEYLNAPWKLEEKDGVAVLTVDFGNFAGEKSYNLLIDDANYMLYTGVDATNGEVTFDWERQYRYMMNLNMQAEPSQLAGLWTRTATEVDGDFTESEPGVCTLLIMEDSEGQLWLDYTDKDFPDDNLTQAKLTIVEEDIPTVFDGCTWIAQLDCTGTDLISWELALMPDGSVLMYRIFETDGTMTGGLAYFERG